MWFHSLSHLPDELAGRPSVAGSEDGLQAHELLRDEPNIVLVILDMSMARMDGLAFLCRVRQGGLFRLLPIIVLFANAARIRGRVQASFVKPVDFEMLPPKLRELFSTDCAAVK